MASYDCDVLIIGAGIVGAACARALHQAGLRVIVLDAAQPGTGTTAACMGHIVTMDDSKSQMQLTAYSRAAWERLAAELSPDCEDLAAGTLWVAEDDEEMDAVEKKFRYYSEWNVPCEILDGEGLRRFEPNLRAGLRGALRVPGDRVVYATNCTRWMLQGIDVRPVTPVAALDEHGARDISGNVYRAKSVVLACGSDSAKLIPELPIEPRKGHLCITDRYPGFCHHQIVELGYLKSAHQFTSESVAFNIQPRPNGQLLLGSSREFTGWDAGINNDLLQKMIARAHMYMPALANLLLLRVWTGFRPATRDKLPLIGAWPGRQGLYIAAGHEGLGITTSLGTADLLAAEILGTTPPFSPTPFRASRILDPDYGHHE
jgi:glycine/D-amino acid oxidase-like deaminating enzyme